MTLVYIDSDVIVASELKEEQYFSESKRFMEYVLKSRIPDTTFFTSVFTFLELASAMIRRTRNKDRAYSLLYQIRNSWKGSIKPYPPLPRSKLTSFTRLVDTLIETSIKFRTPSGDTIHAQTAVQYEIDYLITWNKDHFLDMQREIKNLKILNPTEALAEFKLKENALKRYATKPELMPSKRRLAEIERRIERLEGLAEITSDGRPTLTVPVESINAKEAIALMLLAVHPAPLSDEELSFLLSKSWKAISPEAVGARASELRRDGKLIAEKGEYSLSGAGVQWVMSEVVGRIKSDKPDKLGKTSIVP